MSKKPNWPRQVLGLDIPIYGGELYLAKDREVYRKCQEYLNYKSDTYLKAYGIVNPFESEDGAIMYLVGWFDESPATLVHELAHVTFFILDRAGVPIEKGGENEAYCYLLDSLYGLCTE